MDAVERVVELMIQSGRIPRDERQYALLRLTEYLRLWISHYLATTAKAAALAAVTTAELAGR